MKKHSLLDMPVELFKTMPSNIALLVPYGSSVYGTTTPESDKDYILVCDITKEIKKPSGDMKFYSEIDFQKALDNQDITAIEAFHTNPLLGDNKFTYKVDLKLLRESISKKSSNSFVKAKKKITMENENTYIGIKSLYHSFRLYDYGIELATTGQLKNFGVSNGIWKELLDCRDKWNDWDFLFTKFKKRHNAKASRFRELCPK